MKTYKFLLTLIICGIFTLTSRAQTNYYGTTQTIQRNGYSYQCDNKGGWIMLYNSNNRFAWGHQKMKDCTLLEWPAPAPMVNSQSGRDKAQALTWNLFTPAQLGLARNSVTELVITMIINSTTGVVDEVSFDFDDNSGYAQIPVEKYREIELAIKNNITFQITDFGKKLNYCITAIWFDPDQAPAIPVTPVVSSNKREVSRGESVTFSVNSPQSGVIYEWEYNGAVIADRTGSSITFQSSSSSGTPVPVDIFQGFTVRCRARSGQTVSAWSSPAVVLIARDSLRIAGQYTMYVI